MLNDFDVFEVLWVQILLHLQNPKNSNLFKVKQCALQSCASAGLSATCFAGWSASKLFTSRVALKVLRIETIRYSWFIGLGPSKALSLKCTCFIMKGECSYRATHPGTGATTQDMSNFQGQAVHGRSSAERTYRNKTDAAARSPTKTAQTCIDKIWRDATRRDKLWQDVTRCYKLWQDATRSGKTWQDVTKCDQMWQDTTDKTRCDKMSPDATRRDKIWPDMTRYDKMQQDVTRCDKMRQGACQQWQSMSSGTIIATVRNALQIVEPPWEVMPFWHVAVGIPARPTGTAQKDFQIWIIYVHTVLATDHVESKLQCGHSITRLNQDSGCTSPLHTVAFFRWLVQKVCFATGLLTEASSYDVLGPHADGPSTQSRLTGLAATEPLLSWKKAHLQNLSLVPL